ncbi:MAG: redoxin domain-containing protein [Armatimonadetes bacterium]|nr:redoxin domain-containing protein [Armatimonadota bacterium]
MLKIGQPAPDFTADSTAGKITLSDQKGQWVVLFAYTSDFSPVSATEMIGFAALSERLKGLEAQVIGVSADSLSAHIAWLRDLKARFDTAVPFPVVADPHRRIMRDYDLLDESSGSILPGLFILDPTGRLRFAAYYPAEVGRSMDEILRLIHALQTSDSGEVSTPCDWQPGQPALHPPPTTAAEADRRIESGAEQWYLWKRET